MLRAVACALLLVACAGCEDINRAIAVAEATEELRARALDPESVRVRDPVVATFAVCGWANARTQQGGYAGFRRFVVMRGTRGMRYVVIDRSPDVPANALYATSYWRMWEYDVAEFDRRWTACVRDLPIASYANPDRRDELRRSTAG